MKVSPVDDLSKLTREQMDLLRVWLVEREKKDACCEICGNDSWTIQPHLISPMIFREGTGAIIGGPAYPFAMIICSNCANTKFINAAVVGLLNKKREVNNVNESSAK